MTARKYDDPEPGTAFGQWAVTGPTVYRFKAPRLVPCRCACGVERRVVLTDLFLGKSLDCGHDRNVTHGLCKTRLHRIWVGMRARTIYPAHSGFSRYGGRGLVIEWPDFSAFSRWALANGYADDLTIDRIDGSKGYSPGNCRWVAPLENQRNKRSCVMVSVFGEAPRCAQAWVEDGRSAIRVAETFRRRLREGWTPDFALTTVPARGRKPGSLGKKWGATCR